MTCSPVRRAYVASCHRAEDTTATRAFHAPRGIARGVRVLQPLAQLIDDERAESPRPQATVVALRNGEGDAQRREVETELEAEGRLEGAKSEGSKGLIVLVAAFEEGGKTARDLWMSQDEVVIDECNQCASSGAAGLEADGRVGELENRGAGTVLGAGRDESAVATFLLLRRSS